MIIDEIVGVVPVRHLFVTAVRSVDMVLLVAAAFVSWGAVGWIGLAYFYTMFVHLIALNVMHMAIMKVVGVAVVLYRSVAATRFMSVVMLFVCFRGH